MARPHRPLSRCYCDEQRRSKSPETVMQGAAKARRRARERWQTVGVLMTLALALIVSLVSWRLFFTAWGPAASASAPRFSPPSSARQAVALRGFLGKQELGLGSYM